MVRAVAAMRMVTVMMAMMMMGMGMAWRASRRTTARWESGGVSMWDGDRAGL